MQFSKKSSFYRALENNTIFYNNFFGFGGIPPSSLNTTMITYIKQIKFFVEWHLTNSYIYTFVSYIYLLYLSSYILSRQLKPRYLQTNIRHVQKWKSIVLFSPAPATRAKIFNTFRKVKIVLTLRGLPLRAHFIFTYTANELWW